MQHGNMNVKCMVCLMVLLYKSKMMGWQIKDDDDDDDNNNNNNNNNNT
jgi:hypothetical protein